MRLTQSPGKPKLTANPAIFNGRFELDENGSFIFCKTGDYVGGRPLSDTSSMRAELSTIPDLLSIPPVQSWEEKDGEVKSDSRGSERAEAPPMNEPIIIFGAGTSFMCPPSIDLSQPTLIWPWRMEAVSLNDSPLQVSLPARKHDSGSASVSAPSLTDGSSLESEIAWLPETVPRAQTRALTAFAHCHDADDDNMWRSQSPEALQFSIFPRPTSSVTSESHPSGPVDSQRESPEQDSVLPYSHDLSLETCGDWSQVPFSLPDLSDDDEYSTETETWSDTESVWMSDYSEGLPVFEDSHPFSGVRFNVVRQALLAFETWPLRPSNEGIHERGADTTHQGTSSASHAGGNDNGTAAGQENTTSAGKRARDGVEESGENDGHESPKKRRRPSKRSAGGILSLACPFAKKDPIQYRGCYGYIMTKTKVVKMHLSRYHQLPIYCPRCKQKFDTEDIRDVHASTTVCQARYDITYEGVTRSQKEQLAQRVSPRMTLEDQWFTVFDILFPGHMPRPKSAFVSADLVDELVAFQDMMYQVGPGIILSTLSSHGIQLSAIPNEEHDLEALQQVALAEAMHTIANKWVESLPGGGNSLPAGESSGDVSTLTAGSSRQTNGSGQTGTSSETLEGHARPTSPGASQFGDLPSRDHNHWQDFWEDAQDEFDLTVDGGLGLHGGLG